MTSSNISELQGLLSNNKIAMTTDKSTNSRIDIYTDGSCKKNGTRNASAGIGVYVQGYPHLNISKAVDRQYSQTNQVAELLAIKEALELIGTLVAYTTSINIYSDSIYAIKCVTLWYHKWKLKGFKKSDGTIPLNLDIIRDIVDTITENTNIGFNIDLIHVKGHSGNQGNEIANTLAQTGSQQVEDLLINSNNEVQLQTQSSAGTLQPEISTQLTANSSDNKLRLNKCINELISIRNSLD